MKTSVLALALLLSLQFIKAQTKIPGYGKIDEADMNIKVCDFDKDADAFRLIHTGKVTYERGSKNDFKVVTERRIRILILKENGIENANQKLRFYSKDGYESISDLKGATYNLENGKIVTTKLESKNIYTQAIDNKYSQVVFTMPAVKVGSVIEFKYTKNRESEGEIDDWFFQTDIPTRISQYDVNIPEYFEFTTQGITSFKMDVKQDERPSTAIVNGGSLSFKEYEKTYTMENIPGLRYEPYMTAPKDYIQQLQFQFSTLVINFRRTDVRNTWEKMVTSLKEDDEFGGQLKKNVSIGDTLKANLKSARSKSEKIKLIYDYVRGNVIYDGSETFWSPSGVKTTLQKHTGSNGDINLLLINLLKDANIEANPMLVSSRDHGMINEMFPFIYQFNNVIAYVEEDDKVFVLDASDKYNPMRMVPFDYLNGKGYLIKDGKGQWISLASKIKYDNMVSVSGEVSDEGVLKGSAFVRSADYARNDRQKKWQLHKDKFDEYFTSTNYASLKINDLKVDNADADSLALEQRFNFETPLNSSGDYKYFSTNLFLTFEKNPFTADTRLTDVDFGYAQHYSLVGSFKIPENYSFQELPKNFSMKLPDDDIVIKRLIQAEDNMVTINIDINVNKTFFSADEYDGLKEIYKRIYTLLNEQIVIKKK